MMNTILGRCNLHWGTCVDPAGCPSMVMLLGKVIPVGDVPVNFFLIIGFIHQITAYSIPAIRVEILYQYKRLLQKSNLHLLLLPSVLVLCKS
jgi:hypothetical protein